MCGIAGMVSQSPVVERDTLVRMRDTMVHRGPDDAGVWIADDRCVGLAHRRLSIVDLSTAGHQPMSDSASLLHVAFNGEIYNFRDLRRELEGKRHTFRTATDTEVILAAYREWGTAFLSRLEGMFALALYDGSSGTVLLARDRAGEKPLFVWQTAGLLAFASELKALLQVPGFPRRLDPFAVDCYLAYGYVPNGLCILSGVTKLLPAHVLAYDVRTGKSQMASYWALPRNESAADADADALTDELEELLARSVARQMVADVPVAVMLSGGVDSSVITALAVRTAPRVKTFTVSFPGGGGYDESEDARIVAAHFGTDHIEVRAEPATVDLLPILAHQYDEPIADSSMVPTYIVSRMIRQHATVALGGDGGDELFAGYQHYGWLQRYDPFHRALPRPLRRVVASIARAMPVGTRGRNYALGVGDDGRQILSRVNVYFDEGTRARLLGTSRSDAGSPEALRVGLGADGRSLLDAAQRMDFRSYLPDDILVKVDRASMLNSLEVRAPLLDPHVIELAFGRVPESLKTDGRQRKILLRRLAGRLLPSTLDLTRKQGFSIPLHQWMTGRWGDFMEEVLYDSGSDFFDRANVRALFEAQRRGRKNEHRLFALTIFELWRRKYTVHT